MLPHNKNIFLDIYNSANNNGKDLLKAANILCDSDHFAQAYVLAYTALEEISKAQFAADVFTGLQTEDEFRNFYRNHINKIRNVGWAHHDASTFPHKMKWVGPDMDDVEEMMPEMPKFDNRQEALYVDVDLEKRSISKPADVVGEKEARDIIHIVEVAFERIWEITGEFGGMQIGTKGFLK